MFNAEAFKIVSAKTKIATTAHPDGKPVYDIIYEGVKVGKLEPYSSYYDQKPKGSRIVTKRSNVTRYSVSFFYEKGPVRLRGAMGWRTVKALKEFAESEFKIWVENQAAV